MTAHIRRLALLILPLVLAAAPLRAAPLSQQDRQDVARIEAYMQGITTLTAQFTQIDQRYGRSTGRLWLHRPGRLRFEYDPPVPFLIIANGNFLVQYDRDLEAATYVPQSSTPAWFLLAPRISLGGDITVTKVERAPGWISLTLTQTKSPDEGSVTLDFAENPLRLERWTIVDGQGGITRVSLDDVQVGQPIPDSKFAFNDPALQPRRPGMP